MKKLNIAWRNFNKLISLAFVPILLLNPIIGKQAEPFQAENEGGRFSNPTSGMMASKLPLDNTILDLCFGDHILYDTVNYGLPCVFNWGTGYFGGLNGNDMAESLKIHDGWSIRLFKNDDSHGPQTCLNDDDPNLWDNYFSDGTVVANNTSMYAVFSTSTCPPPDQPNLKPYTPTGWQFPIVPSSAQGTTSVYSLYESLDTYLNFAYTNTGTYATGTNFRTCLYYDESELICEENSLAPGASDLNTDILLPGWHPTEGWHTLKIETDVDHAIMEIDETDNIWEREFFWLGEAGFTKLGPDDNATDITINPVLSWTSIDGTSEYEYCLDVEDNDTCETGWTSTDLNTSVTLSNILTNTTFFWQVRAVNGSGEVYPDDGEWYQFRTAVILPGEFHKSAPSNGATNYPLNPTISWTSSSLATSYEYCYNGNDIIPNTCYGTWTSIDPVTSYVLGGLTYNRSVYWQVRAVNASGVTYADDNVWWHFSIMPAPAGAFNKASPANSAVRVSTNLTLSWTGSTGASYYEYCISTYWPCMPNTPTWNTATSLNLSGLAHGTTYYWQVSARRGSSYTYADGGWTDNFSFRTIDASPGAFSKIEPSNDAMNVMTSPTLSWQATSPVTEYLYCYDKSDDEDCANWASAGLNTSVELDGLDTNSTYFWQVKAINNSSDPTYADGSLANFRHFTTLPTPPPLILVPGLGGTRLVNDQGELWLGLEKMVDDACSIWNGFQATNEYLNVLQLNSTGTAPLFPGDPHYASVTTGGMLDSVHYSAECLITFEGDFLVYQPLIDGLERYGYRLDENLFLFGYDWRRDIRETASALDTLVNQVRGGGKVNIVAHSMGGLVSRNYILNPTRAAKVDHLVIMGTPFLGTPSSFRAFTLGDDFGINKRAHDNGVPSFVRLLDPERVKLLVKNWPGIYEVLPSLQFFNFYPQGYINENRDIDGDGLVKGNLDYPETLQHFYATLNTTLVDEAIAFHSSGIDSFNGGTGDVKVSVFVGAGKPTPGQFRFWTESLFFNLVEVERVSVQPWNGDGTVVLHSVDLRDWDTNLAGAATIYYVNEGHVGLFSNPNVQKQIISAFSDQIAPVNANISLSASQWTLDGTWIEVSTTVELHVYDALGNHLGPTGGDVENTIPGAEYSQNGNTLSVFLPAGPTYQIIMKGLEDGDFDLRMRQMQDDVTQTTVLFKDTTVTEDTTATISTDPNLDFEMDVDQDGDGVVDEQLPPTAILDAIQSLDQTPPHSTIQIEGVKNAQGFYSGLVTITLSAEDEPGGSGVARIWYSLDGSTPEEYSAPLVVAAGSMDEIQVKAIDVAGNEESPLPSARLDPWMILLPIIIR